MVHGVACSSGGRYAYARPVSGYRPNTNVYAPRNNVNVNVNNVNVNGKRQRLWPAAGPPLQPQLRRRVVTPR